MAAAASSTAAILGGPAPHLVPSRGAKAPAFVLCSFPPLRRRSSPTVSIPFLPGAQRSSLLKTRASSTDNSSGDAILADLKEKWDGLENKSIVLIYGGGAIVALWLSSIVVGAINSVPLLPKIMELVGLGYTGWFVYRYLLYKSSRKELADDIEALTKKIAGTE